MTADPNRRVTVEYFLQTRQPDDTWEDSSSFMDAVDWAEQRLAARRGKYPEFEHRIACRTTTVVVEPFAPAVPAAGVSSSGRAALLHETADRSAIKAEAYHDCADEIEARQARMEHEERDEHGNLDHETELQGEAVRDMAKYLREQAARLRRVAAEEQPAETQDGAARVASLEQEVKRLGLMVDEYGSGAWALTDKLQRVRDMHRKTCPLVLGGLPVTAFRCGMCELLDAPAPPVVGEQPDTQEAVPIHACPPNGSGLTPCCGRTPFEMPGDRMTDDPDKVTCPGSAAP